MLILASIFICRQYAMHMVLSIFTFSIVRIFKYWDLLFLDVSIRLGSLAMMTRYLIHPNRATLLELLWFLSPGVGEEAIWWKEVLNILHCGSLP